MECSLAKPQSDQKTFGGSSSQNSGFLPSYPPQVGYGLVGGAYGALVPGYGVAGLAQVRYLSLCMYRHVFHSFFIFIIFSQYSADCCLFVFSF